MVDASIKKAIELLKKAADAKKCFSCGCFHDTVGSIKKAYDDNAMPESLREILEDSESVFTEKKYECLGCDECWPAIAVNVMSESDSTPEIDPASCGTDPLVLREGWPPYAGNFKLLKFDAPLAVCTLNDERLYSEISKKKYDGVSITGTLQTENLGIERIIINVISNPNIRFLILCGEDSKGRIGHLPGQSLIALYRSGIDAAGNIIGAKGKRPVIKNITADAIDYFRDNIELLNLMDIDNIVELVPFLDRCLDHYPGPAEGFQNQSSVKVYRGDVNGKLTLDNKGYFIIFPNASSGEISLEHYNSGGVLNAVIKDKSSAGIYLKAIELGLISRLDHAAYLGKELERAYLSLEAGENYVQDAAPEPGDLINGQPDCDRSCCEE